MGMAWLLLIAIVVFAVFVVVGVWLVAHISNKKWGYTEERERELEKNIEQGNVKRS